MQLSRWAAAFVFTQVIEIPIYMLALRTRVRHPGARLVSAFGPSAITHPMVWFVIPHLIAHPYLAYLAVAEGFAVAVEAIYLYMFGVRQPLAWSLFANATSVAVALFTRRLFQFP